MEFKILNEIKKNPYITEKELSIRYHCHERTIRRYIKVLKDKKIITIENYGIHKKWIIIDKLL